MNKNNTEQEIWQAIMQAKKPICCIDGRFDFDAFGSALALSEMLTNHGKKLTLTWHSKIPNRAKDLLDISEIQQNKDPVNIDFSEYDLLITMDSGSNGHTSLDLSYELPKDIKIANIDHHMGNEYWGELNYIDENAISTCKLLYKIFVENKLEITKSIAQKILLGHITDSGFLGYMDVKSEDVRLVANLMDLGADLYVINKKILGTETLDTMKNKVLTYSNMNFDNDNRIVYTVITQKQMRDIDLDLRNVEIKPADLLKSLDGARLAFSIRENEKILGTYNISFRSNDSNIDVSKFAKALGGGGHRVAASGDMQNVGSVDEVINKVYEIMGLERPQENE